MKKPLEFLGSSRDDLAAMPQGIRNVTGAYRVIYVAKFETAIYVLHAFQKKTQQTARRDIGMARIRYRMIGATQ